MAARYGAAQGVSGALELGVAVSEAAERLLRSFYNMRLTYSGDRELRARSMYIVGTT